MGLASHRAQSIIDNPAATQSQVLIARQSTTLYSVQLGLNLVWMPLFFGLRRPIEATIDIVALLGMNAYLTYLLGSVDRASAYLLTPYVAWLSYATYLSMGSGYLNGWHFPGMPGKSDLKKL
jgi:translocator protein